MSDFSPTAPFFKVSERVSNFIAFIYMSYFQRKMESFMRVEFLKAQSNSVSVNVYPAKHKPP